MQRRLLKSLSPGTVFTTVLEAKEFAEQLPRRINRVLESLASSQLKLKVEVIDEGAVIDGLQKVANRITMGLVVAALIVGAAMMMRIESRFTLLGYPGFPAVLMLVAGGLAGLAGVQHCSRTTALPAASAQNPSQQHIVIRRRTHYFSYRSRDIGPKFALVRCGMMQPFSLRVLRDAGRPRQSQASGRKSHEGAHHG